MNGDTRARGSRVVQPVAGPSRRLVVIGTGAAALAWLTDRGLRLDLPQPPPPVPTRRPVTDERLLVSVVRDITALRAAIATHLPSAANERIAAQLRTVLDEQARTITGRLTNDGVPTSVITAAPQSAATSAPETTPSPATKPATTADAVADRLVDSVPDSVWKPLTSATVANRELCSAAYTLRLAGAVRLGRTLPLGGPGTLGAAQPQLAERSSALVYAFEVVAAQSIGAQRTRAITTLDGLHALAREVGAGAAAGWALPFEVTSPADAKRLATHSLHVATASLADLAGLMPDAATLAVIARWVARVSALAVPWGVPLTAFPGTGS